MAPKKPTKRKVSGARVTPKKGGTSGSLSARATTARPATARSAARAAGPAKTEATTTPDAGKESPGRVTERPDSGRYTAPIPRSAKVSPWWVPALMFALLGVGMLVIFLNYLGAFGDPDNVNLIIGLGLILAGIITATQYH